jgi:outer membrane receptor protein involved in Fe transport
VFTTPQGFAPDSLTNNELGWKTEWLGHHLQFNGAVYQEDWKNVQVSFFDPQGGLGNLTFLTNGPNYRIRGVETQFVALVHGFTVSGSASWNSSNQTNSPYLLATKGPLAGEPITSIPNPYGPLNSPTAESPPFQGNLRVRYDFTLNDYNVFVQAGGQHQAHSYSATGNVEGFDQSAYTTYDASLGVAKDAWSVQVIGQNLTDTRADLFTNATLFIKAITVNRPRTVGVRMSYKF